MTADPQGREPAALDLDALDALCAEVESNKRASIAEQMQHGWQASHLLADAAPALIAEVRRLRHEGAEERTTEYGYEYLLHTGKWTTRATHSKGHAQDLAARWPERFHAMQRVVGPWTVSEGKP